jgi:putative transposase
VARRLRVQYPGAIYHVMNRGDRREVIFKDDWDRKQFVETLGEACEKTGWQIHAWCLMPNHFHLVVETPQANLVTGMKWLLGTYTGRFNRRHKLSGHLFSGRYKAQIVDGSGNGYLKTVCDYVHLNPVRARLVKADQKMTAYPWSSLRWYLQPPRKRPAWMRVKRLLGEHRIPHDSKAGRQALERRMEQQRWSEEGMESIQNLRRGWYVGDRKFRQELLAQMNGTLKEHHYGEERAIIEEEQAERVVVEGLKKLRWKEADLTKRRKGDMGKLEMALRLRRQTTMTLKWIAERLKMGTWTHLNHLLYWHRRKR